MFSFFSTVDWLLLYRWMLSIDPVIWWKVGEDADQCRYIRMRGNFNHFGSGSRDLVGQQKTTWYRNSSALQYGLGGRAWLSNGKRISKNRKPAQQKKKKNRIRSRNESRGSACWSHGNQMKVTWFTVAADWIQVDGSVGWRAEQFNQLMSWGNECWPFPVTMGSTPKTSL